VVNELGQTTQVRLDNNGCCRSGSERSIGLQSHQTADRPKSPECDGNDQLRDAFDHLSQLILDGLAHGFFDYSISCEIGGKRRRQLLIRAGKSHKFIISEEELSAVKRPGR